ncbi:hypothetical protein [Gimesia sp.]|uniref:hypothetical protein n=1 Tax=Gimesia sp. TaxID=2024833 RepID=UPI003A954BB3
MSFKPVMSGKVTELSCTLETTMLKHWLLCFLFFLVAHSILPVVTADEETPTIRFLKTWGVPGSQHIQPDGIYRRNGHHRRPSTTQTPPDEGRTLICPPFI